jgi:hypothetical protein
MDEGRDTGKAFLGRGWAFPPSFERRMHAGVQSRVSIGAALVAAEDDIRQSLRILLGTVPGERVMQAAYGCGIHKMVFEVVNDATLTEIRHLVEKAILFFEPRVTVNQIAIDSSRQLEGELHIHIDYTVRTTNSRNNMVYPMYFREGTGLPVTP